MKISFLILNLGVFGSVRRVVTLSNLLIKRGYEVTIYTDAGVPCEWLKCDAEIVPIVRFLSDKHEVIIFLGNQYYPLVQQVEAELKISYVIGLGEYGDKLKDILLGDMETDQTTLYMRQIIHDPKISIIANCTALSDWIKNDLGRFCLPVFGGVDFNIFHPRSVTRKKLMILASGRSRLIEGTTEVIRAFEFINKKYPRSTIHYYAKRGYPQETLAELYQTCNIFLSAKHRSGWDNPVAEAFACGTPVICTDLGGNHDFVVPGHNAMVIDVRNENQIINALIRLFNDPAYAYSLGKNAAEDIKKFTWDRACDQLEYAINYYGKNHAN